jgi:hypothetical protein
LGASAIMKLCFFFFLEEEAGIDRVGAVRTMGSSLIGRLRHDI